MKKFNLFLIAILALALFSSCKDDGDKVEDSTTIPTDCTDIHWTHSGDMGAAHWVDLCTGYSDCGGTSQSPVDITGAEADASLSAIGFNDGTSKVDIINNGHTVQFNLDAGSKFTLGGKEYELLQFHFHGKSEHTVAGSQKPLEVHFVSKYSDSDYAVVGFFFEEGEENPLFTSFLANFPTEEGTYTEASTTLNIGELFPENKDYYHYSGSLTTPPCSEVVSWYVMQNSVTASAAQISSFQAILKDNFRPVQPLNGRQITKFNN